MVWAQAADGVIGAGGALPWHLPEDLRLFRALTTGGTVVMGRRTWESLPPRFRPLPGRRNVVLSSGLDPAGADVQVVRSVDDVLALDGDLWVIGGGAVYAAFLPHADELVVTEVDTRVAGDTWAPALDGAWVPGVREPGDGWVESAGGLRFRVTQWCRSRAGDGTGEGTDDGGGAGPVPAVLAAQRAEWDDAGRTATGVGTGR